MNQKANYLEKGLTLVSGPSRSGKSNWAESLLFEVEDVLYIATSDSYPDDKEWQMRIEEHRRRRNKNWKTLEVNNQLSSIIKTTPNDKAIIVDSLGGYVNYFLNISENEWTLEYKDLLSTLIQHTGIVIIVIEETGWGVVPTTHSANIFRDRLGKLAQKLDSISTSSWLVIQGRAINMHKLGISVNGK